jgi:PAS domain S-box-containing protein/putative nucleotidyltransferase with HDIG domain
MLLDTEGKVMIWNPAAERIFGWKEEEVMGKLNPIVQPEKMEEFRTFFGRAVAGESLENIEVTRRRKDGSNIEISLSTAAVRNAEGLITGVMSILVDITARKLMEAQIYHAKQDWEETFDTITDMITIHDKDFNIIRSNKAAEKILGLPFLEVKRAKCFNYYHGTDSPPEGCPSCQCLKTGMSAAFEIFEPHLNMFIEIRAIPRFDSSGNIAGLIHVVRDITDKKEHERKTEAIVSVSSALRAAKSRTEMLPITLGQSLKLMGGQGAALVVPSQKDGFFIELAAGEWEGATGTHIPEGKGLSEHVIRERTPYLNNNISEERGFLLNEMNVSIKAVAAVPLITHERALGALWVGKNSNIGPGEIPVLVAIGDIAANAVYRVSLYEQTEQRLKRLYALHTIDTAISGSLDIRVTLNVLLEQVITYLMVDAADVLLLNPHTQFLEYTAGKGFLTPAIQKSRLRPGEGCAGRAVMERRVVSIPDINISISGFTRTTLLETEHFISAFCVPLITKGHVKGVLEVFNRSSIEPDSEWLDFLDTMSTQAAIAVDNASLFNDLERSNIELVMAYDTTIEGWAKALDYRDKETEGHSRRVTDTTLKIAREMGMTDEELVHIRRGALLHDIGKLGVPDNVLFKPGKLDDGEWAVMKRHPETAYNILSPISFLRPSIDVPYCHHEKWDGTGYPRGLKGERIPLSARIFAIVDVWDALSSDRPYRPAWPEEKVREYLTEQSGSHFDPKVVEVFLKMLKGGELQTP